MPSRNTYHLTWVSLTLDVGYVFTAAPAKRSHCSLPWTRGISSPPPLLTLNVEWLLSALLCPCSCRSLDLGLLLLAAAPDLWHGVAPLFRYDLNQFPYDYTVEVTNRYKGLHLIDRVPEELWREVCDTVQEAGIKTITKKKK